MGPGGFNKEGKVNSVFLKDMPFILDVGRDAWHRDGKTQPVNITLRVDHVNSIQDAAASDDISQSLDYGKLYKNIQRSLDNHKPHCNVRTIAGNILPCIQTSGVTGSVQIDLPKAALRAEGGLRYTLEQNTNPESVDQYEALRISDIKCACIIGVNRHERRDKQMVIVHLSFINDAQPSSLPAIARSQVPATVIAVDNYHDIIDGVAKVREAFRISYLCR